MANRFSNLELTPRTTPAIEGETTQKKSVGMFGEADRDAAYWLNQATHERRRGNYEPALRLYSRALELERQMVEGWVGQVRMLIALGEFPEADLWARKALELFRNHPDLLAGRAQALCRQGDTKQAMANSDAALAQPGQSSFSWLSRGEVMLASRQNTADYCFEKAAQIDRDWLTHLEIGDVYQFYGRPAKALRCMTTAVEMASDEVVCWYRRGECELAMGMTAPAKRSFETCLQLLPGHADARQALIGLASSRKPVRNWLKRLLRRR